MGIFRELKKNTVYFDKKNVRKSSARLRGIIIGLMEGYTTLTETVSENKSR